MSAVLGETDYTTTFFSDSNMVTPIRGTDAFSYCGGCNGSFRLSFDSTSIGTSGGVYGAGFSYRQATQPYTAFVTFGDGRTQNYLLDGRSGFFGITDALLIQSIHLGGWDGAPTSVGTLVLDDLRIGAAPDVATVPEPGTLLLLGAGLIGIQHRVRRRKPSVVGAQTAR